MPVHFDVDPILNASGVRIYTLWRWPFDNCVRCSDKASQRVDPVRAMGLIFLSVFANLKLGPTDIKRLQKRTFKLGSYIKKLQTSRSYRFNTVILYFKNVIISLSNYTPLQLVNEKSKVWKTNSSHIVLCLIWPHQWGFIKLIILFSIHRRVEWPLFDHYCTGLSKIRYQQLS